MNYLWKSKILEPVGILGFGLEGKSTYSFLRRLGISPLVFDQNPVDRLSEKEQISGKGYLKKIRFVKTLFRSAGIIPFQTEIVKFVKDGGILTSQVEFFSDFLVDHSRVIAVTGTVGKGTCCTLLSDMLEKSDKIVHLIGNVGKPVLDTVEKIQPQDWVVMELSSFQLSTFRNRFPITVVLETTIEHLDWHSNRKDYWECKANLVRNQITKDKMYFYPHDEGSQWISSLSSAQKEPVSVFEDHWIINQEKIQLQKHQLQAPFFMKNAAMVSTIASQIGISFKIIKHTILNFSGLPHRLELCRTYQGIQFYNDSNATRSESTIGALGTFTKKPLGLILGGSSKGTDFLNLIEEINRHPSLISISLIGDTSIILFDLLKDNSNFQVQIFKTLKEAILFLISTMETGVVLLSPACASFDQFKNYQERGELFKQIVAELEVL